VTMDGGVVEQVRGLLRLAEGLIADDRAHAELHGLTDALDGPLRVAFAGRVKAGKSTLLNALVGERLAPTDAGECTKVVTVYKHARGYEVLAVGADGASLPLPFGRDGGALKIDLGECPPAAIDHIEVGWPSSELRDLTLIDTPGLASIDDVNSRRTQGFMAAEERRAGGPDAVVYLMRHLHHTDAEFLDAFLDRTTGDVSPVNAVAVLSRADEIGVCRLDALESAERIAARYRELRDLRSLVSTVVPVAGLLAETGQTLREHEFASLRSLAAEARATLDELLVSVDGFCDPHYRGLPVETRRSLLDRLGIFGLRLSLPELAAGRISNAPALAQALVAASGLTELQSLIRRHFLPRAQVLRSRSALAGLSSLISHLPRSDGMRELETGIERVEAAAHEFAELRLAHLVLSGTVELSPEDAAEAERVSIARDPATRVGLPKDARAETIRAAAQNRIEHWRTLSADPLSDPVLADVCEIVARSYEAVFAANT